MSTSMLKIAVLTNNGAVDQEAMLADFNKQCTALIAERSADQDTVKVELNDFLLSSPGLKTISKSSLVRALFETRIESGKYKDVPREQRDSDFVRLETVVSEYIAAHPDLFHAGRKMGVAVRQVPGEKNEDGTDRLRHTAAEWATITAKKETPEAAPAQAAA